MLGFIDRTSEHFSPKGTVLDMQGLAWSGKCSVVNVFELYQAKLGVDSEREPG